MKLLLAFNLLALAFVAVTNSGYVGEIVPGQDPLTEYGIIAGNIVCGWLTFAGWRMRCERLERNFKYLYQHREELFSWKQQHTNIFPVVEEKPFEIEVDA